MLAAEAWNGRMAWRKHEPELAAHAESDHETTSTVGRRTDRPNVTRTAPARPVSAQRRPSGCCRATPAPPRQRRSSPPPNPFAPLVGIRLCPRPRPDRRARRVDHATQRAACPRPCRHRRRRPARPLHRRSDGQPGPRVVQLASRRGSEAARTALANGQLSGRLSAVGGDGRIGFRSWSAGMTRTLNSRGHGPEASLIPPDGSGCISRTSGGNGHPQRTTARL